MLKLQNLALIAFLNTADAQITTISGISTGTSVPGLDFSGLNRQLNSEDLSKPEFAHLTNFDGEKGPKQGTSEVQSCEEFCVSEAKRINPQNYEPYRDECIEARCKPVEEKPEYEFDPSCKAPHAFDCKDMSYKPDDKCFEVCKLPIEEAKDTCESYCRGQTKKKGFQTDS